MLAGRTHEYLAQYVDGVPVHRAGVMRQLDRGVTVSLLGTLHRSIDIAADPLLSAVEVAARVEQATGAARIPGHPPQLVVLPLPDGSYARTYRLLTEDARIHFADAATGAVVHAVEAFDAQVPSVAGRAGDIVTLDLRFYGERGAALLAPGPFRMPRWAASDVAAHADVDLHTARTYDYLRRRFGWFGPDGVQGRIVSLVNAAIRGARAYRPPYGPDGAVQFFHEKADVPAGYLVGGGKAEGGVVLRAEGVRLHEEGAATTLALQYAGAAYRVRDDADTSYSRQELTNLAAGGDLLVTITARLGRLADYEHPQPTLRPHELPILPIFPGGRPADFPELHSAGSMRLRGEHIQEGAYVLVHGRPVTGAVACEEGTLPHCVDDTVIVELDRLPAEAGLHLLQVQNPQGLFRNDLPFHVLDAPARATSGNLISSGGTFDSQGAWRANLTNASVTWEGEADFAIDAPSSQPWRVQLSHHVAIREGVEYSLCYAAKGDDFRYIQVNVDTGPDDYRSPPSRRATSTCRSMMSACTRGAGAARPERSSQEPVAWTPGAEPRINPLRGRRLRSPALATPPTRARNRARSANRAGDAP